MRGVLFSGSPQKPCSKPWNVTAKETGEHVGEIGSGVYSPHLKSNIGLSMIRKGYWQTGTKVYVETEDKKINEGKVCNLPFKLI